MEDNIGVLSKINFIINITVAVAISFLVITLSLLYIYIPDQRDTIRFVTILIGGGSAIYSAYYSGAGLRSRIAQEKVTNAQAFINAIYDVDLTKFRIKLGKEFNSKQLPEEQYEKISSDEDVIAAVRISLNLFDSLSIAIQHGYADEVIAQKALGFIVPYMYGTFTPYISAVRDKNHNKLIYCEVERISKSWETGKFLYSGKPIPNNSFS